LGVCELRKYTSYFTLVSFSAFAQAILFLIAPLITRLYSPEDLGAFGIMMGLGAMIASICTGRLEHSIPVAESYVRSVQIMTLAGLLTLSLSILVIFMVLMASWLDLLMLFYNLQFFNFLLIPVIALSLAIFNLISALLLREQQFIRIGIMKLCQGLVMGGTQLLLGWTIWGGAMGLAWAQIAGYQLASWYVLSRILPRIKHTLRLHGMRFRDTFSEFKNYPLILAPAALFNQAAQHIPVFALGYLYGLYAAGLYALVVRVCGAPLGLLGQAVAQVYTSEFRAYLRNPRDVLAHQYLKTLSNLLMIGCIVISFIVIIMNLWGRQVFGIGWSNIGIVSLLMAPMLLMDFATTPISLTLGYVGGERIQLIWDVGRLLSVVAVFGFAQYLQLSHAQALMLLSSVWSVCLLIHALLTFQACRTFLRKPICNGHLT
jgi:O-antigen/teichoic acid export membrane protein